MRVSAWRSGSVELFFAEPARAATVLVGDALGRHRWNDAVVRDVIAELVRDDA